MLNDNSAVNNINETELYEETESSSLNKKVSVLFYEKDKFDSTEKNNSFQSETPKLKKENISYIEKLITEEKARQSLNGLMRIWQKYLQMVWHSNSMEKN